MFLFSSLCHLCLVFSVVSLFGFVLSVFQFCLWCLYSSLSVLQFCLSCFVVLCVLSVFYISVVSMFYFYHVSISVLSVVSTSCPHLICIIVLSRLYCSSLCLIYVLVLCHINCNTDTTQKNWNNIKNVKRIKQWNGRHSFLCCILVVCVLSVFQSHLYSSCRSCPFPILSHVSFSVVCVVYSRSLSHLYCSFPCCVCLSHVAVKSCKPVSVHLNTAHMETMEPTAVTGCVWAAWEMEGLRGWVCVCALLPRAQTSGQNQTPRSVEHLHCVSASESLGREPPV